MNLANEKYDELIMSYLEGRCSDEEALALLAWIAESESNRACFDAFKEVWDATAFDMPDQVDVEAALVAVNAKIDSSEQSTAKTVEMPWLRRNYKYVSGIAAALVVALFIGFLVKPMNPKVVMAAKDWNAETPYLLPDGSSVAFGGDAQVSYPKHFDRKMRSVDFEGVARFDVAKDAAKPFVLHCGTVDVEVLGTSFLVDARKDAGQVVVDLYSGQVRMTSKDRKGNVMTTIELLPGQRGICQSDKGELTLMTYPEVKDAELKNEHVLDFNDVNLSTIVATLEYIFEVKIVLSEDYANEKMTARFTDEDSVSEVIETIAAVFGFEVSVSKDTYILR